MARMLRMQQAQLDSLAKDRKILEDRIKLQHERWVSDVNLFQEQIYQVKFGSFGVQILFWWNKVRVFGFCQFGGSIGVAYEICVQLKRDFTAQEMEHMVEAAKLDLIIGLKEREAYIHKDKSGWCSFKFLYFYRTLLQY